MFSNMSYTTNLGTPAKLQFSYKAKTQGYSYYKFYVDGILTDSHVNTNMTNFITFTTALLPTGNHIFTWQASSAGGGNFVTLWLDNIGLIP